MLKRLKLVFLAYLFCSFILIARFYYWQIYRRVDLRAMGEYQYASVGQQVAERGVIYSKDGYPLVQNTIQYTLTADPKLLVITNSKLEEALKPIINQDFTVKPFLGSSRWVKLASHIDQKTKTSIENLKIIGLSLEPATSRFYPEASLSAHLIGFVGNDDSGQPKGYYGLEGFYDRELKGRNIAYAYQKDAVLRPITSDIDNDSNTHGRSLITNIDRLIQFQLEKRLSDGIQKYQAKSGFGIILDPKDGSVLALAVWPNYEPDKYWNYDPELYRNPVISSTFEPGSIFKVLVMASAIEDKVISEYSICDVCQGPRVINDYTIRTWNNNYYPNTSPTDILVHSDNVGMIYVAEKLGLPRFLDYYSLMGFNHTSGIDLEGEATPPIRPGYDWGAIDLATASFGQGIAVTPIQIISAVNAIASGGIMYRPRVVNEVIENTKHLVLDKPNGVRIFQPETTQTLTKMMINAVEAGEAKWAKPKGYIIAGKTGTAQIPIAGHYDPQKTVASFIGFAPADKPRFTMLISLVEPKTSPWGSETAAPLWFNVAGDIFRLWRIPPTE